MTGKLVASQVENNIKYNIKDASVTVTDKDGTNEKNFLKFYTNQGTGDFIKGNNVWF